MSAKVSKKEVEELIENLKNGAVYQNQSAGYTFRLRNGSERITFFDGKYHYYKNLEAFAKAAVKKIKAG